MFRGLLLCGLAFVAILAGCDNAPKPPPIKTFPAKGKLLTKTGEPVTTGAIEFLATSPAGKRAFGAIGPDGTFELVVMDIEGTKFPGAEEGTYAVTYIPIQTDAQEAPIRLPATVTVKPEENQFELKLP